MILLQFFEQQKKYQVTRYVFDINIFLECIQNILFLVDFSLSFRCHSYLSTYQQNKNKLFIDFPCKEKISSRVTMDFLYILFM